MELYPEDLIVDPKEKIEKEKEVRLVKTRKIGRFVDDVQGYF